MKIRAALLIAAVASCSPPPDEEGAADAASSRESDALDDGTLAASKDATGIVTIDVARDTPIDVPLDTVGLLTSDASDADVDDASAPQCPGASAPHPVPPFFGYGGFAGAQPVPGLGMVLVYGDSIGNASPPNTYPSLLGLFLGSRIQVVNHSQSGTTTPEILANLVSTFPSYADAGVPIVVLVQGGTNDLLDITDGGALASIETNQAAAIDYVHAHGAKAVLFAIPPNTTPSLHTDGGPLSEAALAWQMASSGADEVVEIESAGPYMSTDGTHPNGDENVRIGEVLAPALAAVLIDAGVVRGP